MSDNSVHAEFTVMFEEPFWIGLYERYDNGRYEVCKITFGAEPNDREMYEFMLSFFRRMRFSPSISAAKAFSERKINPKRMQRLVNRKLNETGVGTKAQQALAMQREENKTERKIKSREQREAEKDRQFAIRREKIRAKHKGH